jgi:hypothetical protein
MLSCPTAAHPAPHVNGRANKGTRLNPARIWVEAPLGVLPD